MRAIVYAPRWRSYLAALWSVTVLISSATLVSACMFGRIDLVDQGEVQVQAQPSPSFKISNIRVLSDPEENETRVYGKVRRLGVYDNAFAGNRVEIQAIFPDGSVIKHTDNILVPLHRTRQFRSIYPEANFKFIFDQVIPKGTILRLTFVA